ncbi:hypothetical protein F2Q70_00032191 [Brassica cretica]|uniref:Uncharacterized protein n=1 Tax=Brassica cretica TaxID=69181 RepID=A0A8S9FFB0_BRACR|nr:hypothetical protein F2Q70_00032191 [Brassica cretica]
MLASSQLPLLLPKCYRKPLTVLSVTGCFLFRPRLLHLLRCLNSTSPSVLLEGCCSSPFVPLFWVVFVSLLLISCTQHSKI